MIPAGIHWLILISTIQSVTGRPGARFGPAGIRRGSQRISPDDAWSIYTGRAFP
jgi:arginase family enzyme